MTVVSHLIFPCLGQSTSDFTSKIKLIKATGQSESPGFSKFHHIHYIWIQLFTGQPLNRQLGTISFCMAQKSYGSDSQLTSSATWKRDQLNILFLESFFKMTYLIIILLFQVETTKFEWPKSSNQNRSH